MCVRGPALICIAGVGRACITVRVVRAGVVSAIAELHILDTDDRCACRERTR